ncbi:hypothetical protein OHA91_00895 [Streptomyces erythrochromogenes]|uniref:Uncharacterized protein n=1 Tax=Streptomyces erythrochromogenes TaxID=285574 RepID=A0ABZ1Q3A1_9ACTN|nr:hypothetical protein [Streptomyces erythrochromogenes]
MTGDEKADGLREGIEDYLGEVDAEDLASVSIWTVVVAGPAPASDTVFLYGVP